MEQKPTRRPVMLHHRRIYALDQTRVQRGSGAHLRRCAGSMEGKRCSTTGSSGEVAGKSDGTEAASDQGRHDNGGWPHGIASEVSVRETWSENALPNRSHKPPCRWFCHKNGATHSMDHDCRWGLCRRKVQASCACKCLSVPVVPALVAAPVVPPQPIDAARLTLSVRPHQHRAWEARACFQVPGGICNDAATCRTSLDKINQRPVGIEHCTHVYLTLSRSSSPLHPPCRDRCSWPAMSGCVMSLVTTYT
jgi:hypothetical protein